MIIKTKGLFEAGSKVVYDGKIYKVIRSLKSIKPAKNYYHVKVKEIKK